VTSWRTVSSLSFGIFRRDTYFQGSFSIYLPCYFLFLQRFMVLVDGKLLMGAWLCFFFPGFSVSEYSFKFAPKKAGISFGAEGVFVCSCLASFLFPFPFRATAYSSLSLSAFSSLSFAVTRFGNSPSRRVFGLERDLDPMVILLESVLPLRFFLPLYTNCFQTQSVTRPIDRFPPSPRPPLLFLLLASPLGSARSNPFFHFWDYSLVGL